MEESFEESKKLLIRNDEDDVKLEQLTVEIDIPNDTVKFIVTENY